MDAADDFGKLFPGALLLKNRYDKQMSTTTNRPVSDKKAAARAAQEASEARLAALREAGPRPRKVLADAVAELVTWVKGRDVRRREKWKYSKWGGAGSHLNRRS
jgi:hypothetical protein